jgi:hypothetical protein
VRALPLAVLGWLLAGCAAPAAPTLPAVNPPRLPGFLPPVVVGLYGNEPVVRVAPDGTVYVAALQDLYVSTDGGATFHEADFKGAIPVYASDSALAVSPAGKAYVAFDWPYAGQTAVCGSTDRGATWACAPVAVPGATDRMWILAPTAQDVYLVTGETLDRPTFAVSHDAGATWTIKSVQADVEVQGADLAWDPLNERVLEAAEAPNGTGWGIRSFSKDGDYQGFYAVNLPAPAGSETLAVDAAGTWWALACAPRVDRCAPAVARSRHDGEEPWNVTALPFDATTMLLPFLAAGPADRVAVAWYETSAKSASDPGAAWRVAVAQTADGVAWNTTLLTPDPVHTGPVCAGVTCLGENRFAGDFLGVAVDDQGGAHVTWERQTDHKLLPTGQQPPPLPSWERVEYAQTG